MTAAYLLANRPGDAVLARRLTAMYAEDGYDLSLHATSRGEQPKQRAGAAGRDVYDVQDRSREKRAALAVKREALALPPLPR